jgi:HlyD family secretion protein
MLKIPSLSNKPTREGAASASTNGAKPVVNPAVKKPRRRLPKKVIYALGAVVVLIAVVQWRRSRSANEVHPEVKTAKAELGDVRATVSSTGKLQAFSTVDVKSRAGGTVLEMAVEEGTVVKKGQLICLIDKQDTTAAYRQATADVESSRASLRQAQSNARLQDATIGPQIQQSAESVNNAQAQLKQARENLSIQGATVGPDIQQSVEAVNSSRAKLRQAQEALIVQRRTSEAAVQEARSGVASAQARLDQASETSRTQPALTRAAINQAQAGVDASEAAVRSAEESLKLLQSATLPQTRASAQAQVEQAKSQVQISQLDLKRQEALLARGFVPQNTVDSARNVLVTANSALQTAQTRLDTLKDEQNAQVQDQQARVEQAKSSLGQSRANLVSAQTNTVQNTLKEKDVTAARAAVRQSQASLGTAEANLRQVAVRQDDVTAAQAALRQAEAALKNTRTNARQVNVRAADVESAAAAVRQAGAALKGAQANTITGSVRAQQIAQAQAQLQRAEVTAENAKANLDQTRVVAPRDGVVIQKYVDEGTIIQSGQSGFTGGTAIVQLADVSRMYVDVQVDEADISLIKAGQKVDILLDAYPDNPKNGKVRKVFPLAAEVSNVTYIHVQVEVDPANVDSSLRPLMNATCDFLVNEKKDVLQVPTDAVKDQGKDTVVTVIRDPGKPLWEPQNQDERKVQVGIRGDNETEIVSGVKKGDTVVTQIIEPVTDASGGSGSGGSGGGRSGGGGGRGGMGGGMGGMGGIRPPR